MILVFRSQALAGDVLMRLESCFIYSLQPNFFIPGMTAKVEGLVRQKKNDILSTAARRPNSAAGSTVREGQFKPHEKWWNRWEIVKTRRLFDLRRRSICKLSDKKKPTEVPTRGEAEPAETGRHYPCLYS